MPGEKSSWVSLRRPVFHCTKNTPLKVIRKILFESASNDPESFMHPFGETWWLSVGVAADTKLIPSW